MPMRMKRRWKSSRRLAPTCRAGAAQHVAGSISKRESNIMTRSIARLAEPEMPVRKRRILVLASKPPGQAPSQRYRFEQWGPHLAAEHGIELEFEPFESRALADLL